MIYLWYVPWAIWSIDFVLSASDGNIENACRALVFMLLIGIIIDVKELRTRRR